MAEIAVRADGLTKSYRLYRRPADRVLDVLGLLRRGRDGRPRFGEHLALDRVSFEIRRGEKVGIIGRNGAGKSTLLKLVTRSIEPSAGTLEVTGATQALLSLGTGFHPDFTGRDNVVNYLAQLGIAGERAASLTAEIVEFAEVEEYIDQPVKTYSSGMGARLMFAASTVIEPDVLVIDEVLGVGDAYFARKSYERIKALCSEHGSTLLLVSHDIYSTAQICERMIWIDRGRIVADGACTEVMAAYERSIRRQEELRLNRRAIVRLRGELEGEAAARAVAVGRITDAGAIRDQRPAIHLSHVALVAGGRTLARIDADAPERGDASHLILDRMKGNWGPVVDVEGRQARLFEGFGSIFHRLPFALIAEGLGQALDGGGVEVEIGVHAAGAHELECVLVHPDMAKLYGVRIKVAAGGWMDLRAQLTEDSQWGVTEAESNAQGAARYGQRRMEITDVRFLDKAGAERHIFEVGDEMRVSLRYRINAEDFDERPLIVVAFLKDGTLRTHRFWHDGVHFGPRSPREGQIDIASGPLQLGAGRYLINVALFREGYMTSAEVHGFFTSNEGVHDMHARGYELKIAEDGGWRLFNDAVFSHPSRWTINGTPVGVPERLASRGLAG
jgi:lipopolysaccharide transport system ATP-binding protein